MALITPLGSYAGAFPHLVFPSSRLPAMVNFTTIQRTRFPTHPPALAHPCPSCRLGCGLNQNQVLTSGQRLSKTNLFRRSTGTGEASPCPPLTRGFAFFTLPSLAENSQRLSYRSPWRMSRRNVPLQISTFPEQENTGTTLCGDGEFPRGWQGFEKVLGRWTD